MNSVDLLLMLMIVPNLHGVLGGPTIVEIDLIQNKVRIHESKLRSEGLGPCQLPASKWGSDPHSKLDKCMI